MDYNMIVFVDSRYIDIILKKGPFTNKKFIPIDKNWLEQNIKSWADYLKIDKRIMNSSYYKTVAANRIKDCYPENIYSEYNIINHSKIDFIKYALPLIKSSFVCWSDFGYHYSIKDNPKNTLDISKFNQNKINMCVMNQFIKEQYDPVYVLQNAPDIFAGSFFGLPKSLVSEFQKIYHKSLEELYSIGLSDDDQHIYLRCFVTNPELFELHFFTGWPNALTYFQKNGNITGYYNCYSQINSADEILESFRKNYPTEKILLINDNGDPSLSIVANKFDCEYYYENTNIGYPGGNENYYQILNWIKRFFKYIKKIDISGVETFDENILLKFHNLTELYCGDYQR
jgi:hypothetical protein